MNTKINAARLGLFTTATAALLGLGACGSMGSAMKAKAFDQSSLPAAVQVPAGHQVVLETTTRGGEITYECREKADMPGQAAWVFVGPKAELLNRAKEIACEMTEATSAVSVALTRQMLWRFAGAPAPFELLDIDKPMSIERGGHADVREGVTAFLEKRPPSFPGKVSRDMPSQYPWWSDHG